jgi:hypothetical protein
VLLELCCIAAAAAASAADAAADGAARACFCCFVASLFAAVLPPSWLPEPAPCLADLPVVHRPV